MASATDVTVVGEHLESKSFKYMWSRYVQKVTLEYDLEATKAAASDPKVPIKITGDESVAQLQKKAAEKTGLGFVPKERGKLDIGIVGAGVSGLFSAMVFDWLNEHPELKGKLKINYDILEAAGEERLGGRLYTHKFSEGDPVKTHDYYDVGAMRFPNNDIMKRYDTQSDPSFYLTNSILHVEPSSSSTSLGCTRARVASSLTILMMKMAFALPTSTTCATWEMPGAWVFRIHFRSTVDSRKMERSLRST